MRVLMIHNRYRQPGGEESVFQAETRLLQEHGLEVFPVEFSNKVSGRQRWGETVRLGVSAAWSGDSYQEILELCRRYRPDVAHVHNFWMRISPSVHAACHTAGVATVQTLHNFRLLCANGLFLRRGRVCEDCLGRSPWWGVAHRCYRNSFVASAGLVHMIETNRRRGTWERDVDAFIVMSGHCRSKFIAGGLPPDRVFVKPNFVSDPGPPGCRPSSSDLFVYVGRLSPEKGVDVLLQGWAQAQFGGKARLLVLGEGAARAALQQQASRLGLSPPEVVFGGWQPYAVVQQHLQSARAVVVPSTCYETVPMSVLEAFSCGRPVIASRLGSLAEIVEEERNGITFAPGDASGLVHALERLRSQEAFADRLGHNARLSYLAQFTPQQSLLRTLEIYRRAVERTGRAVPEGLHATPSLAAL